MTPISSLKFSNIENYYFFRVSVDQEKKVEKKYVSVFRFGVSVFRGLVMSFDLHVFRDGCRKKNTV